MIQYQDPEIGRGHASVEFLRLGQSCRCVKISSVTVLRQVGEGRPGFQNC